MRQGGDGNQGVGGLGDALGLDDDNELNELDIELANEQEQEAKQEKPTKIAVYITIDEDDDNDYEVDLNKIFKNDGNPKPYSVEVSVLFLIIILGPNSKPQQLPRNDHGRPRKVQSETKFRRQFFTLHPE